MNTVENQKRYYADGPEQLEEVSLKVVELSLRRKNR